jgi:hypothetical protein
LSSFQRVQSIMAGREWQRSEVHLMVARKQRKRSWQVTWYNLGSQPRVTYFLQLGPISQSFHNLSKQGHHLQTKRSKHGPVGDISNSNLFIFFFFFFFFHARGSNPIPCPARQALYHWATSQPCTDSNTSWNIPLYLRCLVTYNNNWLPGYNRWLLLRARDVPLTRKPVTFDEN